MRKKIAAAKQKATPRARAMGTTGPPVVEDCVVHGVRTATTRAVGAGLIILSVKVVATPASVSPDTRNCSRTPTKPVDQINRTESVPVGCQDVRLR
jgi:hypothetical protein